MLLRVLIPVHGTVDFAPHSKHNLHSNMATYTCLSRIDRKFSDTTAFSSQFRFKSKTIQRLWQQRRAFMQAKSRWRVKIKLVRNTAERDSAAALAMSQQLESIAATSNYANRKRK